jgi:diguanylate cyclase (GGDEF)-like protein
MLGTLDSRPGFWYLDAMASAAKGGDPALETLLDLTQRLTEDVPLEEALQAATDAALVLLPGNHASVRLLDDTRTQLLCGARSGSGSSRRAMTFHAAEGVAGWVVENGSVACISDVEEDPRYVSRKSQGFRVRSMLAVPLSSAGQVVGVLSVSAPGHDVFGTRHVLLARLLANCASPAFEKARLERLTVTDPGTRAFNRRYLLPRMDQAIARARSSGRTFSALMMDLDHFKRVNDIHGHGVGDAVLAEFAHRVREATRDGDELVRWGGEEFVLLMPGATAERARRVAERVRAHVARSPFAVDDLEGGVVQTVSIGVSTWDGEESPDELVARADAAMYRAKNEGRDRVSVAE